MLIYSYHTHSHWLNLFSYCSVCIFAQITKKISLCSLYWGGREIVFQSMEFLYVPKNISNIYSIEHNIKEVLVFAFYMTGTILLLLRSSKKGTRKKFWMEVESKRKIPLCRLFLVSKHRHKLASCAVVWVPTYISSEMKCSFPLYSSWNRSTFRVMCKTM